MSILEQLNKLQTTQWLEQMKKDVAQMESIIPTLENYCQMSYEHFWMDEGLPLTLSEANSRLSTLGTAAKDIFSNHGVLQEFILSQNTSWEVLKTPYTLIFNKDGSAYAEENITPVCESDS